jgi:serine/threonine-protein kinase OSR1/STK39
MCLVKNPTRRPIAEKLLKHSFFKHSETPEYLVRTMLDNLLPLGQSFLDLKVCISFSA